MKKRLLRLMVLLLLTSLSAYAQERTVTGTIKASDGTGMPGVNVVLKGSSVGTSSDADGKFAIAVLSDQSVLVFSFIGHTTQEIVVGSKTTVDVTMVEDAKQLGEVVVTALGIERDTKALGYSVTNVKGEEFTKAREISVANALVGKIAGVNSTAPATGPGGSSRVTIRGNSSLSGNNQPLYVINGIQMNNDNLGNAGKWDGADYGDGISSINPDDIEDITVLKGGSAAALYGQRGRNGVILITTKSGKNRKGVGIEVNSNNTLDQIHNYTDFQTNYGQGTLGVRPADSVAAMNTGLQSWGAKYDGAQTTLFDGKEHPYSYVGKNNLKNFYQTGYTTTNTVAISGGGESGNFRLSVSDLHNRSVYREAGYNRNTVNLDVNYKLSRRWSGRANVNYTKDGGNRTKVNDAPGNGNYAIMFLPGNVSNSMLSPGYYPNGNELRFSSDAFTTNPYFATSRFRTQTKKDRVLSVASLRYNPADWIYIQARIANDYYAFNAEQITPTGTAYRPTGQLDAENTLLFNETNTDLLIGIDKDLTTDFSVSATLGGNMLKQTQRFISVSANGFAFPYLYNPGTASSKSVNLSQPHKEVHSVYAAAEFSYKNMLFLNVTDRNDWSSALPNGNNSYNYPSVNLSYNFSEMLHLSWLEFGKIRAGYSKVGSDTDPFQTSLYYSTMGNAINGIPVGQLSNTVPNGKLKPLQVTEREFGTNLKFFQNRLFLDAAWYHKETTNDIVTATASNSSGYQNAVVNIGKIQNQGIELLIGGTPVKGTNLKWTTSFNITNNKNKVIALAPGQTDMQSGESRTGTAFIKNVVGKPFSQVMVYDFKRDGSGNLIVGPTGLPQQSDALVAKGTGVHPITGGWNNEVSYKSLTLAFLIDFKHGGVIYSGTNSIAYGNGLHKETLKNREEGVDVVGVDDTGAPKTTHVTAQNYYGALANIAALQVYNADFIKFRSISLTYNVPSKVLGSRINALSISLVGRNLFYIKKNTPNIDPESNYNNSNAQGLEYTSLPTIKTYGVNLNLKF